MKTRGGWAALAVLAAALALAASATAQPAGSAEVLLARAPAEVIARGQTAPRPLVKGARLAEGDRIRTGRGGALEIRLGDGSLVRLAELSELEIDRLDVDAAGVPTTSRFSLAAGQARAWVARQLIAKVSTAQGGFAVRTPTAVAAVRQTDFAVLHETTGASRVYTFDGVVETTSAAGGSVLCSRNRWTRVEPGRSPDPCGVIPLRDKRSVLVALAFQSVTLVPGNPNFSAIQSLSTKLTDEKLTGAKASGGSVLAPGIPTTGSKPAQPQGEPVNVIVTVD